MNRIVVIGSLNIDLVVNVEDFPKPGETLTSLSYKEIPGGKGANQAVAAAKLNANVAIIGKVGTDGHGDVLLDNLKEHGVDTSYIKREDTTGKAFINVDADGENHIVLVPGANYKVTKQDIDDNMALIEESDMLILQMEIPLPVIEYALEVGKKLDKKMIFNPAPAQKIDRNLLKNVHTLIPNESELEILTGLPVESKEQIEKAAQSLIELGMNQVIVTIGSQGSLIVTKDEVTHVPALKVETKDTTAAGDSFVGAYSTKLIEGYSAKEAAEFASKVAALTVTKEGAQSSLPTLEEVENAF